MSTSTTVSAVKKQQGHGALSKHENLIGWAFLSLNLAGYILFKLIPLIIALVLSFCEWNFVSGWEGIRFVGLENYGQLFSDEVFLVSLRNTIFYAIATVPIAIFIALIFGVILNDKVYFKSILRLVFYLPNISSMVAVSLVWMFLFLPSYGPINEFLQTIGIANPPRWLNASSTSLLSIAIVGIWQVLGYNTIIILAGLQGIPESLYEAAEMDGANAMWKFFKITIPSLSNTLFFLTIISIIRSFQVFTPVQIMTEGGPGTSSSVIVYYIYTTAFQYNNIGYASSMAWVLFLMVFVFAAARMRFANKGD
ncbi:sugar ABC transporter permease [Mahella sp.]|uniref:carbohydrate ABC transporter permease n=1 Tax=Mahella sp. TaxID=2798721 RepID=UPI0025C5D0B1|nr:sugar ABC transporter permease [Mahella sp.]MBZ4665992.1 transporter, permease protein [Mahella sp.]MDK2903798.1 multiple sugar transport system permease protein [Clostridiales bacterium]